MKTKTRPPGDSPKKTVTITGEPTPINITPEEGMKIRECSDKTGLTVDQFVRKVVLERCAKLEDDALTAIPCPFCKSTDSLEILPWTNERKDGTEYDGDAVRCNRCDAIAAADSWARRGLSIFPPAQEQIQGIAAQRFPARH